MDSKHSAPRRQNVHRRPAEPGRTGHSGDPRRSNDPRRRRPTRRPAPKKGRGSVWTRQAGWIFLAAVLLILALALGLRACRGGEVAAAEPDPTPAAPGSAFDTAATAAPIRTAEGSGGRKVEVGSIQTGFAAPGSVTVGVLKSVDLTALGETVRANVGASGWGEVVYSLGQNGELLLRNASQIVLNGADFQKQQDFLATDQPENLARTFLENSGLIPLLRGYGLELSVQAENSQGMITFRGSGDAPGAECAISFSFLYTGAFNQAVLRASFLDGAITTDRVLTPARAAENAVTWSSADNGRITVTDLELRQIRGLPFYVYTGSDGTVAYALAVEEAVLDPVPGARETYRELLRDGIQEYVEISGAA